MRRLGKNSILSNSVNARTTRPEPLPTLPSSRPHHRAHNFRPSSAWQQRHHAPTEPLRQHALPPPSASSASAPAYHRSPALQPPASTTTRRPPTLHAPAQPSQAARSQIALQQSPAWPQATRARTAAAPPPLRLRPTHLRLLS
nr:extensin-like [Lolium perenne]